MKHRFTYLRPHGGRLISQRRLDSERKGLPARLFASLESRCGNFVQKVT
jgi:hypothetical protein